MYAIPLLGLAPRVELDGGGNMAKKVAVPSMVGTTVDSAETALADSGLGVVKRYVSGEPDGTIYAQSRGSPASSRRVTQ